jgi:ribosomal protein L11 methylase PrmA
MIGEVIESITLNAGNNQIDLGDKSGILFITTLKNGEVIKTEKVVKL